MYSEYMIFIVAGDNLFFCCFALVCVLFSSFVFGQYCHGVSNSAYSYI